MVHDQQLRSRVLYKPRERVCKRVGSVHDGAERGGSGRTRSTVGRPSRLRHPKMLLGAITTTVVLGATVRPSLSVVIPAYNERGRLPSTLGASLRYLRNIEPDRGWEVIVVDDGSIDGTAAWAAAQQPEEARLRVVRSPSNCGKGAALAAGVRHATGERLLFMDADGGTPLEMLPILEAVMDAAVDGSCGVVVGARQRDTVARPWHRQLMGVVFAVLTASCVRGVADTQCGFKLLDREAAHATMPHLRVQRWAYDVELLFLAQRLGLGVASAPVPTIDVAGSKIRWHTPFGMLRDIIRVSVLYRLGLWALPPRNGGPHAATSFVELVRTPPTKEMA